MKAEAEFDTIFYGVSSFSLYTLLKIIYRLVSYEFDYKFCLILYHALQVTPIAHFQNDLGLDSLDTVEIVMALEEEFRFEIPDNESDKINSINLAVDFVASHPQAK